MRGGAPRQAPQRDGRSKQDAEIFFVLTTTRPETLEAALRARPGRIDQAIEFPLPDEKGRAKLVRLYARRAALPDEVARSIVTRTEGMSGAFVKELMRRAAQFHPERGGGGTLEAADVDAALDERLFKGGELDAKLLAVQGRRGAGSRFTGARGRTRAPRATTPPRARPRGAPTPAPGRRGRPP